AFSMFSPSFTGTTIMFLKLKYVVIKLFDSRIAAQNYTYFLYLQNFPVYFIENSTEIVPLLLIERL
ncbi:MAG TPA: hypothetical protein K8U81_01820, partial [Phocaeicola coprocola]|nr:hypothetical protein [Phocaeicola coprocola]